MIQLGDRNAQCVWVYLCGLTTDFNSAEEISTRKTLHELGQKLNIGFLAVIPPARCLEYGDKLCWPHNTDKEVLETYKQLIELTKNKKICGFIGFSNGGFFLNRLIQISKINIPIISIAAAGYLSNTDLPNSLYLVVGENDIHHYEAAQEFYTKSKICHSRLP